MLICHRCYRQAENRAQPGWLTQRWTKWVPPGADNPTGTIELTCVTCPPCRRGGHTLTLELRDAIEANADR